MVERKKVETFEDLLVWQKGIQLVKQVYLLTADGKLNRDFGLRDQLQRAAVSIPTNIAEGFERASRKEYLFFLNIAKGSAGDLRSLLRVAREIGHIDQATYERLKGTVIELSRYLANQIKALRVRTTNAIPLPPYPFTLITLLPLFPSPISGTPPCLRRKASSLDHHRIGLRSHRSPPAQCARPFQLQDQVIDGSHECPTQSDGTTASDL